MKHLRRDEGNVAVEFIGIVVALMVPLTFIAGAVAGVANSTIVQEAAARAATRAFVVAPNSQIARTRAHAIASTVLRDAGISSSQVQTVITCSATPCLTPGEVVTVTIMRSYVVTLGGSLISRKMLISARDSKMVDVGT